MRECRENSRAPTRPGDSAPLSAVSRHTCRRSLEIRGIDYLDNKSNQDPSCPGYLNGAAGVSGMCVALVRAAFFTGLVAAPVDLAGHREDEEDAQCLQAP